MPLYGLIGHPLGHSWSKDYFTALFATQGLSDHRYELFDLTDISELPALILNQKPSGLNVTIPYKSEVLPYLNFIDIQAKEIGAVNCIVINEKLELSGFNTDFLAFREILVNLQLPKGIKALILGSGGSSKAVAAALNNFGIQHALVSRSLPNTVYTWDNLDEGIISSHRLIINCTPLGMWPDINTKPALPYQFISQSHIIIDLVYNPAETLFMSECRNRGARVYGGLDMLHRQAQHSWRIWQNR
jgi:shikimate dehydrogenase